VSTDSVVSVPTAHRCKPKNEKRLQDCKISLSEGFCITRAPPTAPIAQHLSHEHCAATPLTHSTMLITWLELGGSYARCSYRGRVIVACWGFCTVCLHVYHAISLCMHGQTRTCRPQPFWTPTCLGMKPHGVLLTCPMHLPMTPPSYLRLRHRVRAH
jgi:hypothetical protein